MEPIRQRLREHNRQLVPVKQARTTGAGGFTSVTVETMSSLLQQERALEELIRQDTARLEPLTRARNSLESEIATAEAEIFKLRQEENRLLGLIREVCQPKIEHAQTYLKEWEGQRDKAQSELERTAARRRKLEGAS